MSSLVVLLAEIALVLATARLATPIARRLGQPIVVAEMVAGIVLGPSALGRVAPRAWGALFPVEATHVLGVLSNIGLVLFVFLVGLELDVRSLRARARAAVGIGLAGFIVPAALAVPLAFHLWAREGAGVARTPFVLFVVAATSITAFPVLARILVERRLLGTRVGTLAVAGAAIVDALSACLVAFLVAMVRRGNLSSAVVTTLATAAFAAAMIFVARPLLARFLARVSPDGIDQGRVGLVIVLLAGASLLTEVVGVGALFGAFMLGAVVPKEHGFAKQLAEKLEDLVLSLFLPLFFAYSGLRTETGALGGASWTACGLVLLVGFAGKIGGAVVFGRAAGLRWSEAGALGALLNTRGVVEVVVLNLGLDLHLVSPAVFTMFILMALASTVAAAPLLDVFYPRERASLESLEAASPPRGFTVVACVEALRDVEAIVRVARSCVGEAKGCVHVLWVRPPDERPSRVLAAQERAEEDALAALATADGDVEVRTTSFVSHRPARDVSDLAEAKDADVVVVPAGALARDLRAAGFHDEEVRSAEAVVLRPPRREAAGFAPAAEGEG